jgi:hypothetical protein
MGIDKPQIRPLHTCDEPSINDVIQKLFIQLNIPHFWIHSIEIPPFASIPFKKLFHLQCGSEDPRDINQKPK